MGVSITGLSGSGIDTSALVTAIMNEQKIPLTSLNTKKEITTAYKDFFTALNTKTATLRDAAASLTDVDAFRKYAATSSDTTKLTASAGDASVAGEYSINVESLAQKQVISSTSFNSSTKYDESNLPDEFTINSNVIRVSDLGLSDEATVGDALIAISKAINSLEGSGVQASVIQTSTGMKSLVLTASEAGLANGVDASFIGSNPSWGFVEKQAAQDAHIIVNGIDIYSSTNTVEDGIPGVKLTLTGKGSSTVKVNQDIDGLTSKVQAFVTAYNDVVTTIRNNTQKSTQNSDGTLSLTLQSDSLLRDLQSQVNNWMNQIVGDSDGFRILSDIGLEIDKGITSASLMTGKISFDSALFKEKMSENPTGVQKMLSGSTVTGDSRDGMATMFKDKLKLWTDSVDGFITTKIKGYSSEISFLSEQITSMSNRLDMKQAALEKKFANMEVMLSSLNSQSDYISNMLKSLTSSSD